MEDADVRSALTAYVTEDEPPVGLEGDRVLELARLSRRRQLLTGAVAAVVVLLALGLALVVLPRQGEVAGPACPAASPGETRAQIADRLSCVVGNAVRSMLAPGVQVSRLTMAGETPPSDVYHLVADPAGDTPRDAIFHLGVRVTDGRGSGSVSVMLLPTPNSVTPRCAPEPVLVSCSVEQLPEGALQTTTSQAAGVLTYRAALSAPGVYLQFWSTNSGVLEQRDGEVLAQRPEPVLTAAQVRDLVLTPGLSY
jgi:hypothetical protein